MGIYRTKIKGRRSAVLVKADTLAKAKDRIIESCDSLNAEEMEKALTAGEHVWREGEDFPDDTPEPVSVITAEETARSSPPPAN